MVLEYNMPKPLKQHTSIYINTKHIHNFYTIMLGNFHQLLKAQSEHINKLTKTSKVKL